MEKKRERKGKGRILPIISRRYFSAEARSRVLATIHEGHIGIKSAEETDSLSRDLDRAILKFGEARNARVSSHFVSVKTSVNQNARECFRFRLDASVCSKFAKANCRARVHFNGQSNYLISLTDRRQFALLITPAWVENGQRARSRGAESGEIKTGETK